MRKLLLLVVLLVATARGASAADVEDIADRIATLGTAAGWTAVRDARSLTLILKGVDFLNPLQLPPLDEEAIWRQFSFKADYRITITWGTLLTKKEFDELLTLRSNWFGARIKGVARNSMEYWEISQQAKQLVIFPKYFDQRFSYFIYTSDEGFFEVRPAKVKELRDQVTSILERSLSKYQKIENLEDEK